jgi:hypothetical protein
MKKIILLAGLAVSALAVSSCDLFENIKTPTVDVALDSSSEIQSVELLKLDSPAITSDSQGVYFVQQSASAPISSNVNLSSTPTKLNGSLDIKGAGLPEVACDLQHGGLAQPAIVVTVENSAAEQVVVNGNCNADSKTFPLPEAVTNAKDKTQIVYTTGSSAPSITDPDVVLALPEEGKILEKGPKEMQISDITVSTVSTKAIAPAAGSYQIKVDAMYVAPLLYLAGTQIHLDRSFKDLNISLDRVNYPCNEYDISMEVENTLPFDIMMTVKSADGISGALKSAIKAGSLEKPVTTAVVLNVKDSSGKNVSNISTADLSIDLTAAEGAILKKGQKLGLKLNKFSVIKAL